jgi:hypothetical protein
MPKMNKQYVKEQIDNAIEKVRAEYEPLLKKIVECPVCGALTFRGSEHVCLVSAPIIAPPAHPERRMLIDYIMDALEREPPAADVDILEANSPYLPAGISKKVMEMGYIGKDTSVGSNIAKYSLIPGSGIKRLPVTMREIKMRKSSGLEFESVKSVTAYWREK